MVAGVFVARELGEDPRVVVGVRSREHLVAHGRGHVRVERERDARQIGRAAVHHSRRLLGRNGLDQLQPGDGHARSISRRTDRASRCLGRIMQLPRRDRL